jgi:hypothetical protein
MGAVLAMSPETLMRRVEYEMGGTRRIPTDPELAEGVLPFTEEGDWDGPAITRRHTQLYPTAPRPREWRCVETAFLMAVVLRGPAALRGVIEGYISRYREAIGRRSTPARIRRWYEGSIATLEPLMGKLDDHTMTYEDLSTVQTELYRVYGSGPTGGTGVAAENRMFRREGYTVHSVARHNLTRERAARFAAALAPGEILSCGVDASSPRGVGPVTHAIHIGRRPDGQLYLYDPWPIRGDQMVECGEDLAEIEHYFVNVRMRRGRERRERRTFSIYTRFTPPAEAAAE